MSWLKPENIPPSGYTPEKRIQHITDAYGELAQRILEAFNAVDPLRVSFGNNPDEYVGYVKRFMESMAGRNLSELSDQEIEHIVTNSFHASQFEQGFIEKESVEYLTQLIIALKQGDE